MGDDLVTDLPSTCDFLSVKMAFRAAFGRAARSAQQPLNRRFASSPASSAEASEYPSEGFNSIMWPIAATLAGAGFLSYRFAPDTSAISEYIAYYFPDRKVWEARNEQYLEQVVKVADDRKLVLDAEAPKLRRRRFPQMLPMASPHSFPLAAASTRLTLP